MDDLIDQMALGEGDSPRERGDLMECEDLLKLI